MKKLILCSSNPMLIKSLYAVLRDEGHALDTIEHPAFAVRMIMQKHYDLVIIDSEPFGLSAEDAAEIIRRVSPGTGIVSIGNDRGGPDFAAPVDLAEFKKKINRIAV